MQPSEIASANIADGEPSADGVENANYARWILRRRSRLAVAPMATIGMLLVVYLLIVGGNRRAATASLERSKNVIKAMASKPVPEDEDAAPLWREAFLLLETEFGSSEFQIDDSEDVYTRQRWESQREAIDRVAEICRLAADKTKCDWGLAPDPDNFGSLSMEHPQQLSRLGELMLIRAVLAAERSDWVAVVDSMQILQDCSVSARHPSLIHWLISMRFSHRVTWALQEALAVPGANPPAEVLVNLEDLAVRARDDLPAVADAFKGEQRFVNFFLDRSGSGFVSGSYVNSLVGFDLIQGQEILQLPTSLSLRSLIWPWERNCLQEGFTHLLEVASEIDRSRRLQALRMARAAIQEIEATVPLLLREEPCDEPGLYLRSLDKLAPGMTWWQQSALALAVMRAAQASGGKWPDDLDELGLPEHRLVDPRAEDGARLQLQRADAGSLLITSIGIDRTNPISFRIYLPGSTERVVDDEDDE